MWVAVIASSAAQAADTPDILGRFTTEAKKVGLPTRFLQVIPRDFLTVEFDDLHAFAAEYHPEDHRLVLNRTLSFNGAGGMLKPAAKLAPRELGTVYHELFHAYLDYLLSLSDADAAGSSAGRLVRFANEQQQCRYQHVTITPILQRRARTETRFLTDRESWEALHETWAVFVGWSVWTKVELQRAQPDGRSVRKEKAVQDQWIKRLIQADRDGDLTGYYEPEHGQERAVAQKRYLAPSHRITPEEVAVLLEEVFEYHADQAERVAKLLQSDRTVLPGGIPCPGVPTRSGEKVR